MSAAGEIGIRLIAVASSLSPFGRKLLVRHLVLVDPKRLCDAHLMDRLFVLPSLAPHSETAYRHQPHRHIIEVALDGRPHCIGCTYWKQCR